jgi:peptidoglycan/xylan/chitin deacetylase (PgdA/CDA1 family)
MAQHARMTPDFGAFVISLDFELLWGVRDHYPPDGGAYRANLLGGREAIPRMLDLFAEFDVAATWATVGFLFARSHEELRQFQPAVLPAYANPRLSPYSEPLGHGEDDDPLHFGSSLIDCIRAYPGQEIATHTYSHFYCLEPGAHREAFQADLDSAVAIAAARGITLRSIVFPRNQYNGEFDNLLRAAGITSFRGTERHSLYGAADSGDYNKLYRRGGRLLDTYVDLSGAHVTAWRDVSQGNGLCNVPASRFLRPYSPRWQHLDALRLRRIARGIERAALCKGIFHLWWHPCNVGINIDENITFLRRVLRLYSECHERHGMRSLPMADVARAVA